MADTYEDYLNESDDNYESYAANTAQSEQDKAADSAFARAKASQPNPMEHTGKTKSYRGPGTWNPLVHTGKMMYDTASGIRQLFGSNDNEFSRNVQDMADTYEEYDQPFLAQVAGAGLMMLPELAISPAALPATAIPFAAATRPFAGAKGITKLAKQIGSEAAARSKLVVAPGLRGGIEGGAYGAAAHVNPESTTPMLDRLKAGTMGATFGATLDALATNARLSSGRAAAALKRKSESGSLPKTVDLPSAELWDQKALASRAKQFRESATDATWDPGQKTKRLYESGHKKALRDIEDNADILRGQMTGQAKPVPKGESLNTMLDELRVGKTQVKDASNKQMDNFLADQDNVLSINADKFYAAADEFTDYVKYHLPGKKGLRLRELETSLDNAYSKITNGFMNAKDLELLRREVKKITKNTNPGSSDGAAANKLHRLIKDQMEDLKLGDSAFGNQKAFDDFVAANNANTAYNTTYNKNRIIREAADGELSANQLSDELFGAKNMQDSAERLDAIDTLLGISPGYKKGLKRESLQQMLSGQSTKGRNFNIDEFISEYGGALDTGRGKPTFGKLYNDKELKQLGDLYNVSRRLEMKQPPRKSDMYADTSVAAQAMNLNVIPTTENLINSPILRKHVGRPLEDYLNAVRYNSGRKFAVGPSTMSGKVGGVAGAHSISESTEEMKQPKEKTDLDYLLDLLSDVVF